MSDDRLDDFIRDNRIPVAHGTSTTSGYVAGWAFDMIVREAKCRRAENHDPGDEDRS